MNYNEAALYEPVKRWLESQGLFRVFPEVSVGFRRVDAVAIGERAGVKWVIGVEMKVCFSRAVLYQASTTQLACDQVYIAVASRPRAIATATTLGIGVLRVHAGAVELLAPAGAQSPVLSDARRAQIIDWSKRWSAEGVGGMPNVDGVGPAQDCKRRVDEYRVVHPRATWRELYANVANHYASAPSMRNALTHGLRIRAMFKRLRAEQRVEQRKKT